MNKLKRIVVVIAGTGLLGLADLAVAQTVLAQFVDDIPIPPIAGVNYYAIVNSNPNSIATIDGQTFYITENNVPTTFGNPGVEPGVVGEALLSDSRVLQQIAIFAGGDNKPNEFGSNSPNGVAVDLMGKVYVADTDNNEIDIFKRTTPTTPFPYRDIGILSEQLKGNFNKPNDVTVNLSNGYIYVADTDDNEIERFDSDLNRLEPIKGDGFFNNPKHVAVNSSNGYIYVPDTNKNEIAIFDSDLNPLDSLKGDEFFNNPTDVVVDAFGNISVIDFDNKQVDLFDSSLQLNSSIDGFNNPTGLTVDESGRVYVLDLSPTRLGSNASFSLLTTTPVPEPSSALGILAFGAMGAGCMLKRKLKK